MTLTQQEKNHRVAVLKKLKSTLEGQRQKFFNYLNVLDAEKSMIESGDPEVLVEQVRMEESIVAEIFTFQKVIDPLDDLYRQSYPESDEEVNHLRGTLESLKNQVQEQNKVNRQLLAVKMEHLRNELQGLRRVPRGKPLYGSSTPAPSLIDITT